MATAIYFHPESMSAAQYDDIIKRLEGAGQGTPKGRSYHSAFGPSDHLMVLDVWDSQEEVDAFGQTLMPILAEVGVDPGQPVITPVHNIIQP